MKVSAPHYVQPTNSD